jgi:hypothetical protein
VSSAAPIPVATKPDTAAGKDTLVATADQSQVINLRDPWLAAFLAWLVPGMGHMYQRRWGKGGLFMTCILATFFYGLWLGSGRVVYASFREPDPHSNVGTRSGLFTSQARYAYFCQFWEGLPALPAIIQTLRTGGSTPKAPLFDGFMAPPMVRGQLVPADWVREQDAKHPEDPSFDPENFRPYDNTYVVFRPTDTDQLGYWNRELGSFFDLGTVFTMIAGLLNVLAIWDAWGGPAQPAPKVENKKDDKDKSKEAEKK